MNILILGGTTEARELAAELTVSSHQVTTSLAGHTSQRRPLAGRVRTGGFGGDAAFREYVFKGAGNGSAFDLLIDATHPFAATMRTRVNALAGIRKLRLTRAAWQQEEDDLWTHVPDLTAAHQFLHTYSKSGTDAEPLPDQESGASDGQHASAPVIFLSLGAQKLSQFYDLPHRFICRAIEAVPGLPANFKLIRGFPGRIVAQEQAFLKAHRVDLLVTRNAGGKASFSKIRAARASGTEVLMIDRPVIADGTEPETFATVPVLLAALRKGGVRHD